MHGRIHSAPDVEPQLRRHEAPTKENDVGLTITLASQTFARVIDTNADLGDWLCQIMHLCG